MLNNGEKELSRRKQNFRLTYVLGDDLTEAKTCPEKHSSLRVRVSGFSDYFVNLSDSLQDDVIKRTEQR